MSAPADPHPLTSGPASGPTSSPTVELVDSSPPLGDPQALLGRRARPRAST